MRSLKLVLFLCASVAVLSLLVYLAVEARPHPGEAAREEEPAKPTEPVVTPRGPKGATKPAPGNVGYDPTSKAAREAARRAAAAKGSQPPADRPATTLDLDR